MLYAKKKWPIIWTAGIEAIFHNLKNALLTAPVVIQPDNMKLFRIEMDTSVELKELYIMCNLGGYCMSYI